MKLIKLLEEHGLCAECGMPLEERGMCNECGWMDETLHGGQKKLDVAPPFGKLTGADFKKLRGMKEDHEVSMADSSLSDIIRNAEELLQKIGTEEKDIPAWIQDHITNAQNFISQANTNYYDEGSEEGYEEPSMDSDTSLTGMMEDLFEAKKKPSAGLSKKQKSAVAKKARAGKDVGKKGKGFEKVAKKAAKKYGSSEKGKKVAAAAMWKGAKARSKK